MFYTYGHTESYITGCADQVKTNVPFLKKGKTSDYLGGAVFKTLDEAAKYIELKDDCLVFGVKGDWEKDTEPDKEKPFNRLLRNSEIVRLNKYTFGNKVYESTENDTVPRTFLVKKILMSPFGFFMYGANYLFTTHSATMEQFLFDSFEDVQNFMIDYHKKHIEKLSKCKPF